MTPDALRGMRQGLLKRAGLGTTLARYARPLVMQSGAFRGAAGGAVLGAGANVAHEAVAGQGDYGGAALRGAAGGALVGAGAGFGVGKARDIALTTLGRAPKTMKEGLGLAKEMGGRTVKSVGDWGKRQVHGTTGWTPKAGPESIGLAGATQRRQQEVVKAIAKARTKGPMPHAKRTKIRVKAEKQIESLKEREAAAKEMYDAGLTSLPGTVKGVLDPRKMKRTGKAVWKQVKAHPGGLAGAAVLPAAFTAADIAQGVPVTEAVGGGIGDAAGMALTGGMPILPQLAGWTALSEGGRAIGRAVKGKKKRTPPKVSPPAPAPAQMQPYAEEAVQ